MISLLIVNYRSASLAANAIRTAREGTTSPLEVVVVDNSCSEAGELQPIADVVITPERNLGYAGGINLGRKRCNGETLIVSNPDVTFAPGALDSLHNADAAVAGPALYWDDAFQWHLPPADLDTTLEKADQVFATRSPRWFTERDRRRIKKRIEFWSLKNSTEVKALSGAVMAIRATDFDDVGGFDERFRLYFEEIDFLRRMSERGKRIVHVPGARCRHLYNQSAGQDSDAAGSVYAQSELRYLEKWSGPFAARMLKRLERVPQFPEPQRLEGSITVKEGSLVEVSPLPSFATAAGHFARNSTVELPQEVWSTVRTPLYYRVLDTISP
ncbi:MAG TPA: glycosyltransferase [Thermoanaerobaculia bacterium]|nr:glycosyltransferase [Thermoanaerobaculia bacterium]